VVRGIVNFIQSSNDVSFQLWVHGDSRLSRSFRLGFSEVFFSKQELPVQVAEFNNIGVSKHDPPSLFVLNLFSTADAKHGIILEEFTADSPCSNHEEVGACQFVYDWLSDYESKSI
jgi:hypothetical protein